MTTFHAEVLQATGEHVAELDDVLFDLLRPRGLDHLHRRRQPTRAHRGVMAADLEAPRTGGVRIVPYRREVGSRHSVCQSRLGGIAVGAYGRGGA